MSLPTGIRDREYTKFVSTLEDKTAVRITDAMSFGIDFDKVEYEYFNTYELATLTLNDVNVRIYKTSYVGSDENKIAKVEII